MSCLEKPILDAASLNTVKYFCKKFSQAWKMIVQKNKSIDQIDR